MEIYTITIQIKHAIHLFGSVDHTAVSLQRMADAAKEKLGFTIADLMFEYHDDPSEIHTGLLKKLEDEARATYDAELDLMDVAVPFDGYYHLDNSYDIEKIVHAYLSVGAGHDICLTLLLKSHQPQLVL